MYCGTYGTVKHSIILLCVLVAGRYGMAIMTYFRFVKWLMFLNFYIMMITFAILVIPFAVLSPSKFDDILRNKSLPATNVSSEVYNMTVQAVNCTQQYIRHQDQVHGSVHTGATLFVDLIQGTVSTQTAQFSGSCLIYICYGYPFTMIWFRAKFKMDCDWWWKKKFKNRKN